MGAFAGGFIFPTREAMEGYFRKQHEDGEITELELEELLVGVADLYEVSEDEDEVEDETVTGLKQWSTQNGAFTPVGDTRPEIKPGMYDISVDQAGKLWFLPLKVRTEDIIRFPDAATDRVISEIQKFWGREELFKEYGLPFKRGILLHGPPGSGKSTTLTLVSRDVIKRKGVVIIFDPTNFWAAYRALREVQPETPVIALMEDIDTMLDRRESSTLNLLDGAESMHKVVFLATTNYPEKLDARVKNRPSRFDRRIEIPHPSAGSRKLYLESIVGQGSAQIDIDRYVRDTDGMSMAHVKELFVATVLIGQPYEDAVSDLRTMMREDPHSAQYSSAVGPTRVGRYA